MSKTTTIKRHEVRDLAPRPSGKSKSASAKSKKASEKFDWSEFDALTDEQVLAEAISDPDAQPITAHDSKRMKRKPRCYSIRTELRMTQEEFADAFRIPVGTVRDWEQWRTEPDQAAKAYMKVIAVNPQYVLKALAYVPGTPKPTAD